MATPTIQLVRAALDIWVRYGPAIREIGGSLAEIHGFIKKHWDIEGLTDAERSQVLTILDADPATIGLSPEQQKVKAPKNVSATRGKKSSTQGQ